MSMSRERGGVEAGMMDEADARVHDLGSSPPSADVTEALLAVAQAARMVRQAMRHRLRAIGLDWPDAAVLLLLRWHGPLPRPRLTEVLGYPREMVTDLLDRLAWAGLIERAPAAPDGGVMRLALTSDGRRAAERADAAVVEIATPAVGSASTAEVTFIASLLAGLREVATARADPTEPPPGRDDPTTP
jgi:DNA-binding MarR family transcriptional regulator